MVFAWKRIRMNDLLIFLLPCFICCYDLNM